MQGRKGIGRYAASILGNELFLETVTNEPKQKTSLYVDWNEFEKAEYLSDVEIAIETLNTDSTEGTKLTIDGDSEFLKMWNKDQFERLEKELKMQAERSVYNELL